MLLESDNPVNHSRLRTPDNYRDRYSLILDAFLVFATPNSAILFAEIEIFLSLSPLIL